MRRAVPVPALITLVLLALWTSPTHAVGLVVDDWLASACVASGPARLDSCRQSASGTLVNSLTSPQQLGPIPGQPGIAFAEASSAPFSRTDAEAYQTPGGWNGASAAGDSTTTAFGFGGYSQASLSVTGTNTDATPASYTFHFLINGGGLFLSNTEFVASGEQRPTAEILAMLQIVLGPTEVKTWRYRATLVANNSESNVIFSPSVFDPNSLGLGTPQVSVQHTISGSTRGARVSLAPFAASIPNLSVAPGGQIEIHYHVAAWVYLGAHDPFPNPLFDDPHTEASAWIADPFGLEGSAVPDTFPASGFDIDGQPLASLVAVPEPGTGPLVLAALLGLAGWRRAA